MTQEEKKQIEKLSVSEGYLMDWYIQSVDDNPPIWTEGHIEELFKDFYLIPKDHDDTDNKIKPCFKIGDKITSDTGATVEITEIYDGYYGVCCDDETYGFNRVLFEDQDRWTKIKKMNQENKDILLKDICARLPYGLWVRDEESDTVHVSYNDIHFENFFNSVVNGKIKLYLRRMSDMTDEEEKEFQDINMYELPYTVEGLDWLNEHGFDYRNLIDYYGLALAATEDMYNHEKLFNIID